MCCIVPVPALPCNFCHINNATPAQRGKDKKKAKYDSLQELRKNKKELEFEQKLYKEKEEMLEKEKQLKINRLAQEVCVVSCFIEHGDSLNRVYLPVSPLEIKIQLKLFPNKVK